MKPTATWAKSESIHEAKSTITDITLAIEDNQEHSLSIPHWHLPPFCSVSPSPGVEISVVGRLKCREGGGYCGYAALSSEAGEHEMRRPGEMRFLMLLEREEAALEVKLFC